MRNKSERLNGVIRELATALSAFAAVHGIEDGNPILLTAGALGAIWVAFESFVSKEGNQRAWTLARKAASATGGAVIALGLLRPDQVEGALGLIPPIIALISSFRDNGVAPDEPLDDEFTPE